MPTCVVCRTLWPDGPRCPRCGAAKLAGAYEVLGLLAERSYGRVYQATDAESRLVTLKEVAFAVVPSVERLEALEREGALLAQLQHPALPRLVDRFRDGAGPSLRLYVATEYVPGETLAAWLARRRFSEPEALELIRQLLDVTAYLHERSPRVIHRDIKPENILLREGDGRVVLVDLEGARELTRERTLRATVTGTIGYMPADQLGGTVDASCDLHAIGATLLELLTRRPPHELLSPTLELTVPEGLSPGVTALIRRLVSREKRARFASAREALAALDGSPPGTTVRLEGGGTPALVEARRALTELAAHQRDARRVAEGLALGSARPFWEGEHLDLAQRLLAHVALWALVLMWQLSIAG